MRKNKGILIAVVMITALLLTALVSDALAAGTPGYNASAGYSFTVSANRNATVTLRQMYKGTLSQQSKWDSSTRTKQTNAMYHVSVYNNYDGNVVYEWVDEQLVLNFSRSTTYTVTVTPYTMEEMDTAYNSFPTTDFLYNCRGWNYYPTWSLLSATGCTYSSGAAVTATPYRYATATPYRYATATPYRYVTPTPYYYYPTATPVTARKPVISITYPNYPTTITQGSSFSIRGTISADVGTITEVKGEILNNYNYAVKTGYAYPNTQNYTLGGSSEINNSLKFGQLSPGTYTYRVTATAKNGSYSTQTVLISQSFTVKSAATATPVRTPSLSVSSANYPTTMYQGDSFSVRGTVYTDLGTITEVKGEILNYYGTAVQRSTANPNSQSYNLSGSTVNSNLRFGQLTPGTYTYRITATAKNGSQTSTKVLVERSFTVLTRATATPLRAPVLSISSPNYPTAMYEGDSFSIRGTVYTDVGTISEVRVEIVDYYYGYTVMGQSAYPNAQSYTLNNSAINNALRFGQLGAGTYIYRVTAYAKNGTQTSEKTLVDRSFTVQSRATATPARKPQLSISGETYPSTMYQGASFSIRGTVSTDCGVLTEVRGEVISEWGYAEQSQTVRPNAATLDLRPSNINQKMSFGKLMPGNYTYRLTATAQNGGYTETQILIECPFTILEVVTPTPAPITPAPITPEPITPVPPAPKTPTPEPTQGPTAPPPVPGGVTIWQIDSQYTSKGSNLLENMTDDNPNTAYRWTYSKGTDKVRFTFHVTDGDISYFLIRNGAPNNGTYFKYCRIYQLRLDFYSNGTFMGSEELRINGDGYSLDYEVVPLSRTYSGATEINMCFSGIKPGQGDNQYVTNITDILFQ